LAGGRDVSIFAVVVMGAVAVPASAVFAAVRVDAGALADATVALGEVMLVPADVVDEVEVASAGAVPLPACCAITFSISPMLGRALTAAVVFPLNRVGLISADVSTRLRTFTSTGFGMTAAVGDKLTILPARSSRLSPGRASMPTRRLPSSTMIFTELPGKCSIIIVVPVIEALTDAARM